jgi:CheY-like chemotaxis protein
MPTALVVDDNRLAADAVGHMLEFLGLDVKVAYGPREAMMVAKDIRTDIVFLDINMPGVDGFEVLSYLQRFPQMQGVPFVFVTSDDQPDTAGRVRRTGALLIIIKPATMDSLELALRKAGLFR